MATTYMGMTLPTVGPVAAGGTAGPEWATLLRAALEEFVDSHDHTAGNGKAIPISGITINADLDFQGYALTNLKRLALSSQSSSLASVGNKNSIYVKDGELYYISAGGVNVQITSGTGLNLTSLGTIGGDFSTSAATVTYSDTAKSFLFKQTSALTADLACGSVFIYENVASGKYSKFQSPTSLATNLSYTLPPSQPATVTLPMLCSTAGILSFGLIATSMLTANAVDNSALRQSAGLSVVGNSTNSTANVADITAGSDKHVFRRSGSTIGFGTVDTDGITDGAVTKAKQAALGQQISSSTSAFSTTSLSLVDVTNATVTITTTGRPVMIMFVADGSSYASVGFQSTNISGPSCSFAIYRGATLIPNATFNGHVTGSSTDDITIQVAPGCLNYVDTPAAGTYTYKLSMSVSSAAVLGVVQQVKMLAFEL